MTSIDDLSDDPSNPLLVIQEKLQKNLKAIQTYLNRKKDSKEPDQALQTIFDLSQTVTQTITNDTLTSPRRLIDQISNIINLIGNYRNTDEEPNAHLKPLECALKRLSRELNKSLPKKKVPNQLSDSSKASYRSTTYKHELNKYCNTLESFDEIEVNEKKEDTPEIDNEKIQHNFHLNWNERPPIEENTWTWIKNACKTMAASCKQTWNAVFNRSSENTPLLPQPKQENKSCFQSSCASILRCLRCLVSSLEPTVERPRCPSSPAQIRTPVYGSYLQEDNDENHCECSGYDSYTPIESDLPRPGL